MTHQTLLGMILEGGIRWSSQTGPSVNLRHTQEATIKIDKSQFTHMGIFGKTGAGKSLFATTFSLYLKDNFGWKLLDFSNNLYENCFYAFPQEDENLLARFSDTFGDQLEPYGYDLEVYYPFGSLESQPSFFEPMVLSYKDLVIEDIEDLIGKKSKLSIDDVMSLQEAIANSADYSEFITKVHAVGNHDLYRILDDMHKTGYLDTEGTLDFSKIFKDPEMITSFSFASLANPRLADKLLSIVMRKAYESRAEGGYDDTIFLAREAGTLPDEMFETITTKGRHRKVHFIGDSQRDVVQLGKTGRTQFTSQAFFKSNADDLERALTAYGIDYDKTDYGRRKHQFRFSLNRLCDASQGICLLNINSQRPEFPCVIAPPVCAVSRPGESFFDYAKEHGTEFISV